MGTTLTNGIYLPNEGEKNCYAGLKTNWETLDQKIADIAALQQAVAGALHREIVENLPTTDIDPNTIYMVLSGTSATENVYDEYMYVNNAWELIGTSATDLTNYYTKGDVDGLLLLKANASDLTSHTGDTTIHVTANDKSKWNTVALIKQLRLVNTQVGSATTIAFANIDDTNGIKVGDKCMDLDAKMFEITAVDTANQTVTVGSALIDLALDGNVVHTSGNETVGGKKNFLDDLTIYNNDSSQATKNLNISSSKIQVGDTSNSDAFGIRFNAGASYVAQILAAKDTTGTQNLQLSLRTKDGSDNFITSMVRSRLSANGNSSFEPGANDSISLGSSVFKWKSVYATNYYYGSNNIEFSTKFVTTDTNQTINGNKTFSGNVLIHNSDTTANASYLSLKNQKNVRGSTTDTGAQGVQYQDKNGKTLTMLESRVISNGNTGFNIICYNLDSNNQTVSDGVSVIKTSTATNFAPTTDNAVTCGSVNSRWSDVKTYKVNALEPSSLSLPSDRSARVDISSYFTDTSNGAVNRYTVPANGFVYLAVGDVFTIHLFSQDLDGIINYGDTRSRGSVGQLGALLPVRKGDVFACQWYTTATNVTLSNAYFIPCQGNV